MTEPLHQSKRLPLILSAAATAVMALALHLDGRIWWCKFGDARIYVNQAWNSSHTSQHLFDPYSFTHVLHGIMFFWIASLILKRAGNGWRFFAAIAAEAVWELIENSTFVIERYREDTASLDYFGDSVANSIGDVMACALGFWVASKIGKGWSLAVFIGVELVLLLWIRDSLLLNVLMLIHPIDAIKAWQAG